MSGNRPNSVGVVTGLAAESRLIADHRGLPEGVRVYCAGADSTRAEERAELLLAEGATALISFGIAGALDPALASGDLILAHSVRAPEGQHYAVDETWRVAVAGSLPGQAATVRQGMILGSTETLLTTDQKAAAFGASGCLAVDMESHAVAAVAARHGVPFLALRAIADTADTPLPAFVTDAVKANGETAVLRAMGALAAQPWQLPAAFRLSRRSTLALARLGEAMRKSEALFRRGG